MDILARISGYLLIALFILGGLGLTIYMVQLCIAAFRGKGLGAMPWWIFLRR